MQRLFTNALVATAVLLGLNAGRVRAEMVNFSYAWTAPSGAVFEALDGGTGKVSLSVKLPGNAQAELGSLVPAVIPAADVTTNSSAGAAKPDSFNSTFNLT